MSLLYLCLKLIIKAYSYISLSQFVDVYKKKAFKLFFKCVRELKLIIFENWRRKKSFSLVALATYCSGESMSSSLGY